MWPFRKKVKRPEYFARAREVLERVDNVTYREALSVYRQAKRGMIIFRNTFTAREE